MNRYRSYGERDDQPQVVGDGAFKGVDEYNASENIAQGEVQQAVNMDFTSQDAVTRGGFVCLPGLSNETHPIAVIKQSALSGTLPPPITSYTNTNGIVYGNGIYVSFRNTDPSSSSLLVCTSDNLDTRTQQYDFGAYKFDVQISFNGYYFILFGSEEIPATGARVGFLRVSTDGITWTTPTGLPAAAGWYTSCETSSDRTVLGWTNLNTSSPVYGVIISIYNGTTNPTPGASWTSYTLTHCPCNIIYSNGIFSAASRRELSTSPFKEFLPSYSYDGITWYLGSGISPVQVSNLYIPGISFGNGVFLMILTEYTLSENSNKWVIYKSTDGINWSLSYRTNLRIPISSVSLGYCKIVFYQGSFIFSLAVSGGTTIGSITGDPLFSTLYGDSILYRLTGSNRLIALENNNLISSSNAVSQNYFRVLNGFESAYGSGVYSDPDTPGNKWIMLVGAGSVGFYGSGMLPRLVSLGTNYVSAQSTIVQCNNLVYLFRGPDDAPLYWDGDWSSSFVLVPTPTPSSGFQIIPNSDQATYYQNRLWVKKGKDEILASDVLDFETYETITNSFNLNTGSSDYIVATFPFGDKTLLVFKNKSILALSNVDGSLADVTATEITRQVGLVGINAVTSVGPDVAYVSYRNVNLITLTATNNSVQHKTLPLSFKIKKIMDRVNWAYAWKISIGYADNKLYVALPVDGSLFCNCVAVYNFVTSQWYGEWNFSGIVNMCIQRWAVLDYLGLQRMHAVTEDGRIFVTDEGSEDIPGVFRWAHFSTGTSSQYWYGTNNRANIQTKLVTRAYDTTGDTHFQRRAYLDIGTNRPNFSVVAYTEGVSESSTLLSNQAYTRSESWKFNDAPYDLTNTNNDYNRAYRKDYSTGPNSIKSGSGFNPDVIQEIRLPLMSFRQGRLSWFEIQNTQGTINIMSVGFESRPGQRSNLVQI